MSICFNSQRPLRYDNPMMTNLQVQIIGLLWQSNGFHARMMKPADASPAIAAWFGNPLLMNPLNMPARNVAVDELKHLFAQPARPQRVIAGVFDDALHAQPFGLYTLESNAEHRILTISGFNATRPQNAPAFFSFVRSAFTHLIRQRAWKKFVPKLVFQTSQRKPPAGLWA